MIRGEVQSLWCLRCLSHVVSCWTLPHWVLILALDDAMVMAGMGWCGESQLQWIDLADGCGVPLLHGDMLWFFQSWCPIEVALVLWDPRRWLSLKGHESGVGEHLILAAHWDTSITAVACLLGLQQAWSTRH